MGEKVYFMPVENREDPSSIAKKVKYLYDTGEAGKSFNKSDIIAVKTHFGEADNKTFIHPVLVKTIIDRLKNQGTAPFLTETATLYRGKRSNAIDHIALAHSHGFGFEKMNVPIIMADGLFGDAEVSIDIDGRHYRKVNIALEVAKSQGLMVLSHFKGHMACGFGGAIKNIGMGLSSRKGKLKQHSVMSPEIISSKCNACGECIKWCPQDTISWVDGLAYINKENCIGCGECLAVCKFGAVLFDWRRESSALQELMAEHAAGVIKAVNGKVFYFNFLINITKDCDCGYGGNLVSRDIGILAGSNIVSVEKASFDLFKKINGKSITELTYPNINSLIQIKHLELLGMGSMEYDLVEVHLDKQLSRH